MSENNNTVPPISTPQDAPAPVHEQAPSHPIAQVPTTTPASVTATAAAATAAVNNSLNGGGEQLPCQWVGCSEKCPSAEALYVSCPLTLPRVIFRRQAMDVSGVATLANEVAPQYRNTSASAMSAVRAPTT